MNLGTGGPQIRGGSTLLAMGMRVPPEELDQEGLEAMGPRPRDAGQGPWRRRDAFNAINQRSEVKLSTSRSARVRRLEQAGQNQAI